MPYILEICEAGKITEVSKYHSARFPGRVKGEQRGKRVEASQETQRRINQRLAAKRLRWLLNANFQDGDYLLTFTYRPEERPSDSKEMGKDISRSIRKLRRFFDRHGAEMKYVYVKEIGKRGAAHIHMVLNRCGDGSITDILRECWDKGYVKVELLGSNGQYAAVAEYFIKYAEKTVETEGKLTGKRWNPSRNLVHPKPVKKVIRNVRSFYTAVKVPAGYYLEPDSVLQGFTREGFDYFSYSLHKIDRKNKGKQRRGGHT